MASERATITVSETVHVARSPADVFDFTQDYHRRPEWDRAVRRATILQESPPRIRLSLGSLGDATIEYTLFRRGERTSAAFVDVDSRLISGGGGSWAYDAVGDGTDWTQTNTVELRHPRLAALLAPLLERGLRSSMRQAMRTAKSMLEDDGHPAPSP
jgi:hypothetical protein